jgi:hypothetical protein
VPAVRTEEQALQEEQAPLCRLSLLLLIAVVQFQVIGTCVLPSVPCLCIVLIFFRHIFLQFMFDSLTHHLHINEHWFIALDR